MRPIPWLIDLLYSAPTNTMNNLQGTKANITAVSDSPVMDPGSVVKVRSHSSISQPPANKLILVYKSNFGETSKVNI